MTTTASATFELASFDENTVEDLGEGSKLTTALITQKYSGDIEGEGSSNCVMYYRQDGTAVIVGLDRVTGTVGGRTGSFTAQSLGTFDGTTARSEWTIIEGTGELTGLRGTGTTEAKIGPNGTVTIDYDLG